METINKKVSGTTAVKLQSASINIGENPAMTICNINTADCNLNLYYSKENYGVDGGGATSNTIETYYILKSFTIPSNKTLSLDNTDLAFNNLGFDMYAKLDAAIDDVDIIINY